jgi:hypothetical protein
MSNPAAVALGRLGGLSRSAKKMAAIASNLKKANEKLQIKRLQTA